MPLAVCVLRDWGKRNSKSSSDLILAVFFPSLFHWFSGVDRFATKNVETSSGAQECVLLPNLQTTRANPRSA